MDRLRQRADFLAVANGARANTAAFVLQGRQPRRSGPDPRRLYRHQEEWHRDRAQPHPPPASRSDGDGSMRYVDAATSLMYVLVVGRRDALTRDFATMIDDLRSALRRLDRPAPKIGTDKAGQQQSARPSEWNDETLRDVRQPQHDPCRHSVRPRPDRLAIFLQRAADGEAARGAAARPSC